MTPHCSEVPYLDGVELSDRIITLVVALLLAVRCDEISSIMGKYSLHEPMRTSEAA